MSPLLSKARLLAGEPGENASIEYFKLNKKIIQHYDLRNIEEYWHRGIDFEVIMADNRFYVETKTIKPPNNNLCIQIGKINTVRYASFLTPGWFYFSEAKYLFVYHESQKMLYIIDFLEFRKWYHKKIDEFSIKFFTDGHIISITTLIPIKHIKSIAKVVRKI